MKQVIRLTVIVITLIALSSFSKSLFAPKLYPEIEQYFKNLSSTDISNENKSGLAILKDNLEFSRIDSRDYNVIFTSQDPAKSLAAQVILHTLVAAKKFKLVNVFACNSSSSVSPELVEALKKIGYKIQPKNNINSQEIRFPDNAEPIILRNLNCSDNTMPTENKTVITLCNGCSTSDLSSLAFNLNYKAENLDTQIRYIARDLPYSVQKK